MTRCKVHNRDNLMQKNKYKITTLWLISFIIILVSACDTTENKSPASVEIQPAAQHPLAKQPDYAPVNVDIELKQVSEHVYYVQGKAGIATDNAGFISNAVAIITDDGVILFDALGTPSLAYKFYQKLREVTDQPIRKLILSHYHADHIYGIQVFKDMGAEIVAPAGTEVYLGSDAAAGRLEERRFSLEPWVNEQTRLVSPDRYISETTKFEMDGVRFTLNYLGAAHSDGDMTLYVEPDRVLLSGDIIFEGRVPYLGDANTRQWLATLEAMETSTLAALIPGHGPAADNPNRALKATSHYLAFVRGKMHDAVENMDDFNEVYDNTDWSEFEQLPAFEAANRRNAYQVYLSIENEFLKQE